MKIRVFFTLRITYATLLRKWKKGRKECRLEPFFRSFYSHFPLHLSLCYHLALSVLCIFSLWKKSSPLSTPHFLHRLHFFHQIPFIHVFRVHSNWKTVVNSSFFVHIDGIQVIKAIIFLLETDCASETTISFHYRRQSRHYPEQFTPN